MPLMLHFASRGIIQYCRCRSPGYIPELFNNFTMFYKVDYSNAGRNVFIVFREKELRDIINFNYSFGNIAGKFYDIPRKKQDIMFKPKD